MGNEGHCSQKLRSALVFALNTFFISEVFCCLHVYRTHLYPESLDLCKKMISIAVAYVYDVTAMFSDFDIIVASQVLQCKTERHFPKDEHHFMVLRLSSRCEGKHKI